MYNKRADAIYLLFVGVIALIIGIFILQATITTLKSLFYVIGYALVIVGIIQGLRIVLHLKDKHIKERVAKTVLQLIVGGYIVLNPKMPVSIFGVLIGIYIVFIGISHMINFYILKMNGASRWLFSLLFATIYLSFGVFLLFSPYLRMDVVLTMIGWYFIVYGLHSFVDMIRTLLTSEYKDDVRRRVRITLPVFVEALIPRFVLNEVNAMLQTSENEETLVDAIADIVESKGDEVADIEVFVHISSKGFGAIGHIDLGYKGKVISYGNYDIRSHHLFETVGDGVLFYSNREQYIPFVILDAKKTLFSFGIKLNDEQKQKVDERIAELESKLIKWQPSDDISNIKDYAARLNKNVDTTFYKFKEGKFKTYYVLGTNCVLLADQILGSAGVDIIKFSGIISPGSYYEYLNKEFASKRRFVVTKNVYN